MKELPTHYFCAICNRYVSKEQFYGEHAQKHKTSFVTQIIIYETQCGKCNSVWLEYALQSTDLPPMFRCPICNAVNVRLIEE